MAARSILWTGGFDSTYLVVDALLAGDTVNAITYRGQGMSDATWQKVANEDEARRRIAAVLPFELRRRLDSRIECDPHVFVRVEDNRVELLALKPSGISPQNAVLANLPKVLGNVETGFVLEDRSVRHAATRGFLERHGLVMPMKARGKRDLLADAQRRGFDHVLALTWSCDTFNELSSTAPCGECDCCLARIIPARAFA